MTYLIFEGLLLTALAGMLAVWYCGVTGWMPFLKMLASLSFVLAGGWGYLRYWQCRLFSGPVLIALLCSMAGDVLLALDKNRGVLFLLGVVSFAIAHVLFSLAFCRVSALSMSDVFWTLAVFAGLALLMLLGNFHFHGLLPVLISYATVISFMTVKAVSLWRCRRERGNGVVLVMCGGLLFLLSDIVLLFWLFHIGMPKEVQCANWILYYLAQGCLSASLSWNAMRPRCDKKIV